MNALTRSLLFTALVAACVDLSARQQQVPPPSTASQRQPALPTFRTDINAVVVDLRVVDSNGEFVRDLTKEDVRVFEDGREQVVTNFTMIDIPVEGPHPTSLAGVRVEPDVASNGVAAEGRLYVIVLDDVQGTPLRAPTVRAIAREFIERNLTDIDRAAVLLTSGRRDASQEFTNNRQQLIAAVDKYQGGFGQQVMTFNGAGALVPDDQHTVMISLNALAGWLSGVDNRRKAIVLISERMGAFGADVDLTLLDREVADVRDLLEATARGNVSIYAIDPVGNPNGAAPGIKPTFVDDELSLSDQASRRQTLMSLAGATGGFALVGSNDFSGAFARVVSENSSYYLLGYTSPNPRRDGKFRRIEVRTNRPGLRVIARSGYVAKDPTPPKVVNPAGVPPALTEILQSPLPVPGLTLSVSAVTLRGESSKDSIGVIVEARGRDLQFTPSGDRLNGSMAVVMVAADKDGKVQGGERGSLTLRLSPGTHEAIQQYGVRLLSRLDLKPGRYQLRVAALDVGAGRMRGSVLYDLVVPDFSKGSLTMSGIAVASVEASRAPTTGPDQRWRPLLGAPPTTRREFARDDELREFIEIYDNDTKPGHRIDVMSTVRSESGDVVFRNQQSPAREPVKGKSATHRVVTAIPLKGIAPGQYILVVEARSSASPDRSVSKEIPFTIR